MATMTKTKITPCAKHPGRTQEFIKVVQEALETFEDEISSLTDDICGKAYKKYVKAYRDALVPVWNLARFASVNTMMKMITDKNLTEISVMAQFLMPTSPHMKVTKDKTKVPDLETITNALTKKFPGQSLLNTSTCKKISEVFAKLSAVSKAYSEAAEGLAKLSTLVMSDQFTMLLTATSNNDTCHLVDCARTTNVTPVHPTPTAATSKHCLRSIQIMNFTKLRVLPNPDSKALLSCNQNSPTRVLATAIYCKLEHNYFDETRSRMDIATAFHCKTSQISKAMTSIDYKLGPHHYKLKKASKQACDSTDPDPTKTKAPHMEHPTTSSLTKTTAPAKVIPEEDTLSSSSDSSLPLGL